ncbi:MAG TPA: HAMP domain-containing sensor histidine kinase [Vicinamibacterales bacterium]|nr:HAMP domain-containing sensor histidine kinase [Vicinamibacterales bacterium]
MLHEFIVVNRDEIISRCRGKVAKRSTPPPIAIEIDHGVPIFLDQLGDALRSDPISSPDIRKTAVQHGHDLHLQGLTVGQVVHAYGDICQSISELAVETNAPISSDDFRMLNKSLDDAIAAAVTQYGRERHQSTVNAEAARGNQRIGFLAHELRNLTNNALLAFEAIKSGNVGVGGSTGAVLQRSLLGLRALINGSLAEVRAEHDLPRRLPVDLAEFIDELAASATLDAQARGITIDFAPIDSGVNIEADRNILAAVVGNLLQNAVKFTRASTTVTLKVVASAERVLIEVHDQCGGLPSGSADDLFYPFEQRDVDRTGMGLGLAFCRWGVEQNQGTINARDVPGVGCVFTIDLPRLKVAVQTA